MNKSTTYKAKEDRIFFVEKKLASFEKGKHYTLGEIMEKLRSIGFVVFDLGHQVLKHFEEVGEA